VRRPWAAGFQEAALRSAFLFLWGLAACLHAGQAQIAPKQFGGEFDQWFAAGATNLFTRTDQGISVSWDSAQPNSYFYFPLGFSLTRADDFDLILVFRVDALELGTTPGKPDTFEIAAGLLNLTNALDSQFFRGAGIDALHGPRNLLEFDYFPASGFITATVAPTIATSANKILFSDNHPFELELDSYYKVQMRFTSPDQTLRSRIWQSQSTNFSGDGTDLKPLLLSTNYGDFSVDALALMNYSDRDQSPPQFSGSLKGSGLFPQIEVIVYNRPAMHIAQRMNGTEITFETALGWRYQLQSKAAESVWQDIGTPLEGTNQAVSLPIEESSASALFRVKAQKL
jgi:hypothetical protein